MGDNDRLGSMQLKKPMLQLDAEAKDSVGEMDSPKFDPKSKLLKTQDSISHNKMTQIRNKTFNDESKEHHKTQPSDDSEIDEKFENEKDILQPGLLKTQDSVMLHRNSIDKNQLYKDTHMKQGVKAGAKEPDGQGLTPLKHQDSIALNKKHIQERHKKPPVNATEYKPAIMTLPTTLKEGDEIDGGAGNRAFSAPDSKAEPKPRQLNSSLEEMKPLDKKARHLDSLPRIRTSMKEGASPEPQPEREIPAAEGTGNASAAPPKSKGCIIC